MVPVYTNNVNLSIAENGSEAVLNFMVASCGPAVDQSVPGNCRVVNMTQVVPTVDIVSRVVMSKDMLERLRELLNRALGTTENPGPKNFTMDDLKPKD